MTFSMATAVLNLASMTARAFIVAPRFSAWATAGCRCDVGTATERRWCGCCWRFVPISALFSALSLAIAAFAQELEGRALLSDAALDDVAAADDAVDFSGRRARSGIFADSAQRPAAACCGR